MSSSVASPRPDRRNQTWFTGKTVWVTGASSGIGAALCRELAAHGARLVLSARRVEELERVRTSCSDPERHRVVPLDLSDVPGLLEAAGEVLEGGPPVDILVNNAGISQRSLALETDLSAFRRILEVNTVGTVALTQAVVPSMLSRGTGQVVVVTSMMGRIGTPMRSAYAASKHALHGYFECLRAETHDQGLRVTLVCPGYIATEISFHALDAQGQPYGRQSEGQQTGMSAEACARTIARGVARQKADVVVGGQETWGLLLFRWFPGLFRWLVRRVPTT